MQVLPRAVLKVVSKSTLGAFLCLLLSVCTASVSTADANTSEMSIPDLIYQLSVGNPEQRVAAANELSTRGPEADAALEALAERLSDSKLPVKIAAAKALRKRGHAARPAVPQLVKALEDPDYEFVVFVEATLFDLVDPSFTEAVPLLIPLLDSESTQTKGVAAQLLNKIGSAEALAAMEKDLSVRAAPRVRLIVKDLQSPQASTRRDAAQAAGELGPQAKDAVKHLIPLLIDRDEKVRVWSRWALEQIGTQSVPGLIKALNNEDSLVRETAAEVLERINTPEAQKAVKKYKAIKRLR